LGGGADLGTADGRRDAGGAVQVMEESGGAVVRLGGVATDETLAARKINSG
jgi:hypothetical protein